MFVVYVSACVFVNFTYLDFLPIFKKSRKIAFRIFRAGLSDLMTNQIACFTVVIV